MKRIPTSALGGRKCLQCRTREAQHNLNHNEGGWSPSFCRECDARRIASITKSLETLSTPKESPMIQKKAHKSQPKSQSEKAADRKSKALDRAGTALINGRKDTAKKIVEKKPKPLSGAQAVEIVSEAQSIELRLQAVEHQIDGVKEHYKELKAEKERLTIALRQEIRDANQGRLPFGEAAPKNGKASKSDAATPASAKPGDEIDRELGGDTGDETALEQAQG